MAEKEERIYIRQYGEDNPCDACEYKSGDECDFCVKNYEWNASITRQEAIEKMAKAICSHKVGKCPEKEFHCNNCWADSNYAIAEAALKALLEGK